MSATKTIEIMIMGTLTMPAVDDIDALEGKLVDLSAVDARIVGLELSLGRPESTTRQNRDRDKVKKASKLVISIQVGDLTIAEAASTVVVEPE